LVVDAQARLDSDRAQTVVQIEALAGDLADIMSSAELVATDDEHDPEGATVAFERSRVSALLAQAREHLLDLDRATARVTEGRYGVCEHCGRPISDERLEARPSTSTCIDCAAKPGR
jgi:DnaK suppressor protein